jgi:hypothetical protein
MSFDLAIVLRGKPMTIRVIDQLIQEHQFDEDGELLVDEIVFQYKVYDDEEEAEVVQLTAEERTLCHNEILKDLQGICDEQESSY